MDDAKVATRTRIHHATEGVERGQTKVERENARLKEQLKFQVRFRLLRYKQGMDGLLGIVSSIVTVTLRLLVISRFHLW